MQREKIIIDKYVLNVLLDNLRGDDEDLANPNDVNKYELIENNINSVDEGDGGVDYTAIIKRIKDGKFFKLNFQEWDIDWEKSPDFDMPEDLTEVFPKQITMTVYE